MLNKYPMKLITEILDTTTLEPGNFWYEDIGWKQGHPASVKLFVVIPPHPKLKAKYEIHWVPCSINGTNIKEDRLWNGNFNKPTVGGSWGIDHFHCWVVDGYLTTEPPLK